MQLENLSLKGQLLPPNEWIVLVEDLQNHFDMGKDVKVRRIFLDIYLSILHKVLIVLNCLEELLKDVPKLEIYSERMSINGPYEVYDGFWCFTFRFA